MKQTLRGNPRCVKSHFQRNPPASRQRRPAVARASGDEPLQRRRNSQPRVLRSHLARVNVNDAACIGPLHLRDSDREPRSASSVISGTHAVLAIRNGARKLRVASDTSRAYGLTFECAYARSTTRFSYLRQGRALRYFLYNAYDFNRERERYLRYSLHKLFT